MAGSDLPPEVPLYNVILVACTKLSQPRLALQVYQQCAPLRPCALVSVISQRTCRSSRPAACLAPSVYAPAGRCKRAKPGPGKPQQPAHALISRPRRRMLADGATPNTKTFTALIGSVGKMAPLQQALDLVGELLATESPQGPLATYQALMAACEKGGLWELALALFDRMASEVGLRSGLGGIGRLVRCHPGRWACSPALWGVFQAADLSACPVSAVRCRVPCCGRWLGQVPAHPERGLACTLLTA